MAQAEKTGAGLIRHNTEDVEHWIIGRRRVSNQSLKMFEEKYTPKTNMDTQNDGLEKVAPFRYGHFLYLC